jgi:hypothetical protein
LVVFGPEQQKVDEIKQAEEKRPTMDISWADTVNIRLSAMEFGWWTPPVEWLENKANKA